MKQHWVPQCYLQAWCDPDTPAGQNPYVWRFTRDGSDVRRKAPSNIFAETDMYTIKMPDGTKNLRLEHGLSTLEDSFAALRREKLDKREPLTANDRAIMIFFVAASHVRSKAHLGHHQGTWKKVLALGERISEQMRKATPEEREAMVPMLPHDSRREIPFEAVQQFASTPQTLLIPMIEAEAKMLSQMKMAIFDAPEGHKFITSDTPVVWFDPEAHKRPEPYRSPGLGFKTVEVRMPVSPDLFMLISWHEKLDGCFSGLPAAHAEEFNRCHRFHCDEYFVSNKNVKDEHWFRE
jgi:hypothetical protein